MDVLVYGIVKGPTGEPYQGAIVKFSLQKSFSYNGTYYHNYERRVVTNKYGLFEISLPPSTLDKEENYYTMTIILDNVTTMDVVVPDMPLEINFSDLQKYKQPYEREEFIGDGCHIL